MKVYDASSEDLAFAQKFIDWNNMQRGIQRVDACKLKDGSMLLVELEDLNPFLSLDALDENSRDNFVMSFIRALKDI